MKYPVYSVRDVQVGFNQPMTDINDQCAKRNFAMAINNPHNDIMSYSPKDFDLFRIGEFDTESGQMTAEPVPVLVVSGQSVYGSEVKDV